MAIQEGNLILASDISTEIDLSKIKAIIFRISPENTTLTKYTSANAGGGTTVTGIREIGLSTTNDLSFFRNNGTFSDSPLSMRYGYISMSADTYSASTYGGRISSTLNIDLLLPDATTIRNNNFFTDLTTNNIPWNFTIFTQGTYNGAAGVLGSSIFGQAMTSGWHTSAYQDEEQNYTAWQKFLYFSNENPFTRDLQIGTRTLNPQYYRASCMIEICNFAWIGGRFIPVAVYSEKAISTNNAFCSICGLKTYFTNNQTWYDAYVSNSGMGPITIRESRVYFTETMNAHTITNSASMTANYYQVPLKKSNGAAVASGDTIIANHAYKI